MVLSAFLSPYPCKGLDLKHVLSPDYFCSFVQALLIHARLKLAKMVESGAKPGVMSKGSNNLNPAEKEAVTEIREALKVRSTAFDIDFVCHSHPSPDCSRVPKYEASR